MIKKKQSGKDEAKRQFLEDWVVDPTFAKSKFVYTTGVQSIEAESSDEEVYTRPRLEHAIGKEDASNLIDGGSLEQGKDKYGRDGWKYGRSRKRRGVSRTRSAIHSDEMDVNADQAKRIREGLVNSSIGLANRGRTTKPKAAISDAEMKEQEILKQVNKSKGSVAGAITKASAAVKNLTGNKHALASKMKTQLETHHTSLQNRLSDVDKVLNDLQAMVKVKQPYLEKIMNSAKTAVDNFNKDVKIAKSL